MDFAECKFPIQIRQAEDGEYYLEGWIYTTHMDRAREDGAENSMFSKECMQQIASAINEGGAGIDNLGARRTVSIMHDWIIQREPDLEPIGMAVPPVEVRQTEDGHWGVYGKTHLNKKHPEFEDTKYRIEHGYYPGFSIEFNEGESQLINIKGRIVKFIKSLKEFLGYGIVNARRIANPMATIESFGYRMVEEALQKDEVKIMAEEEVKIEETVPEQPIEEEVPKGEEQPVEEEKVEEETEAEKEEETETRTAKVDSDELFAQLRQEMKKEIRMICIRLNIVVFIFFVKKLY
ncbi:MAG: hypothetical protein RQ856_05840 [Candidatus Izemoplasmatales bacterium]|nr:hypothetical protein [Candidatus Izemoplasmatales bacterium]